jgi:hypothetical protein
MNKKKRYWAEIRRITVQGQPRQIVLRDPISKNTLHKKRAGRVVQGVGPVFKHQYQEKKKVLKFLWSYFKLYYGKFQAHKKIR